MVSSPIIKLLEAIALKELRHRLEPRLDKAQVGFLRDLNTQTNILRLFGKVIDLKADPKFRSGIWFVLLIDFKNAFDRINHTLLFQKLSDSGVSGRTVNIVKLLYNAYHFTLPGEVPHRIRSGVAQGSLISPILYNLYLDDLIRSLSGRFTDGHVCAYADDLAVLCSGHDQIRETLSIISKWADTNGAMINKKKCGVLRISKKNTKLHFEDIDEIPVVQNYRYLGIPVDQAFKLDLLVTLIKNKIKAFNGRINLIPHTSVGLRAKLNLWQSYARCHFEYFAATAALCGQLKKFESLYSLSLKRALDLPMQTQNERLLKAVGVPSLAQIAAHHCVKNTEVIKQRFPNSCPRSLTAIAGDLAIKAQEYNEIRSPIPIKQVEKNKFILDLLANRDFLNKNLVGLFTGTFLTIRFKSKQKGNTGVIQKCPLCGVPASQMHFLNVCPCNVLPRKILSQSVPRNLAVKWLSNRDYDAFYKEIRCLEASLLYTNSAKQEIVDTDYVNLATAASAMANLFVSNTLSLFKVV